MLQSPVRSAYAASPTFDQLSLLDRIALLKSRLLQLSADQIRAAVKDPECLGLAAEESSVVPP